MCTFIYLLMTWSLLLFDFNFRIIPAVSSEIRLAYVEVEETAGLNRWLEYIELQLQTNIDIQNRQISAIEQNSGQKTICQIYDISTPDKNISSFSVIFPVSIDAGVKKSFELIIDDATNKPVKSSDLSVTGTGFDIIIENKYFSADLSKSLAAEPQSHDSGQIRELLIKMGFRQLLTNAEDRVHWAPNFKRPEIEYYTTIAHWDNPEFYSIDRGPYMVQTKRQDFAPAHPEIILSAMYRFYSNLPFFKFSSTMEMVDDVWLELLRNDEMTMDSMFTHLAFKRPSGEAINVTFERRDEILNKNPIENNGPWLFFYNIDRGFAFGSIRLKYNIRNDFGMSSPTFRPHTQIGEWIDGIKYWNRRLIHDQLTFVPGGSRYFEENAYLVFDINRTGDPFETIEFHTERLKNPLVVTVVY